MKMHDIERRVLDRLWPLRPFDTAIVAACAVLVSVFGSPSGQPGSWLWIWVGTTLGLTIVLAKVRRRVRSIGSHSSAEGTDNPGASRSVNGGWPAPR